MRSHPLTPMTDSSLPRVLAAQSESEITTLPLPVVRDGVARVRTYLQYLRDHAGGPQIVLCDALDDDDLLTIADATRGMTLIAGAAGLGRAIARTTAHATLAPTLPENVLTAARGPAAVIAGSCSAATLGQVEAMAAKYPTYRLGALELANAPDTAKRALAWAQTHLPNSPVLIAASQTADEVADAQHELGSARAAELVETALGTIACGLRDIGVSKLIVAGGETSGAVVNRLGLRRVRIGPPLAPGVPWIYTEDSPAMLLALKSGNFGEPRFFLDALAARPGAPGDLTSPTVSASPDAGERFG